MTALSPDLLTTALEQAGRPLGLRELLRAAGLHPGKQTDVKRVLRELVHAGKVLKEGKRFSTPSVPGAAPAAPAPTVPSPKATQGTVRGKLHVHPNGFGFVHPAEGENIYLPPEEVARALDQDEVVVRVVQGRGGRTAGKLVDVVQRRREQVVGTYREEGKRAYVEPRDSSLAAIVRVPRTQLARDGDMVKVRLGVGGGLLGPGEGLTGEVSGSLGRPGDPSVEVLSIAYSQGFADEFPPEVMDAADGIALAVSAEDASAKGRTDLRSLPLVTIDGEDARDFDDAIHVEKTSTGFRLVVAIADVSHYVREGTVLDREAVRRATSVYLPGRVLPMLPERLSNGICSLKPDEDRLCMVADMVIDRTGTPRSSEVYAGVMRSVARCTYNEVHRVLAGEEVPGRTELRERFATAMELARTLRSMRERRGAIDFDLPETRIELDDHDQPTGLVRRDRLESHRLVEECMLAANEAVARWFQERGLPTVYRFHGEPDEEKLESFAALARIHGFPLAKASDLSSQDLNGLLEKLEGHPEQRALNQLLLRSMMQAVYSSENVGHYGLAAEHYLHFTSPIRRYPDLLVHRMLKAEWARAGRKRAEHELEAETEHLEGLAQQCSERERAAMQVEREVSSFYACLLLKDRIGEEFGATVSSLTDFGFFVELDELLIEGLVKGETVEPNFRLDPALHALVFGSGQRLRVGERLRVRLASVNLERRQIDFVPVEFEESVDERPRKPHRPQKPERRPKAAPTQTPRGRRVPERARPPPGPSPPPRAEPVAVAAGDHKSPHPGFDRLRALAAKGRGVSAEKPRERPPTERAGGKKQASTSRNKGGKGGKGGKGRR